MKNISLSGEAVQPGFEPGLTDPESVVLPLHHWTICIQYKQKKPQTYEV